MRRAGRGGWIGLGTLVLLVLAGCGGRSDSSDPAADASSRDWANSLDQATGQGKPAADLKPVCRIETSLGAMTVELDAEKANLTVDNFLQYVDAKHYDGTIFHQVTPGYAIVGGSYTADLAQKPTRVAVRNEAHNGLKNLRGTIAMARQPEAIDSATCQFFINLADNPDLDHKDTTPAGYGYCVFGHLIDGLDTLEKIAAVPVHKAATSDGTPLENAPVEPVVIKSIRRGR